ncbi:MAG: glycosyltransferase family 39 protein [Candidatus Curtissbacteria bacterium]|nr:glycosyltransferase family 39 protein [Candidatus Curtissbacteria bacterium]
MTRIKKFLIENYAIFLILIFGAVLLSININKPFIGHHDFNSACFSQIAHNLTRYSIFDTKLGLVSGSGPLDPNHLSFSSCTHNVPLYPWLLALSFYLFGQGEFQARIISVVASLGILLFVYKITEKLFAEKLGLFSKPAAVLAAILFVTSPMIIYFGSNVFPEPQAIFFSLASFYFFILWLEKKRTRDFCILLITSSLSMFTVWGSYFLPPLLVLYYLIFEKKKDFKKILAFGLLPIFIFGLFLVHLFILQGANFVPGLSFAFSSRLNVSLPKSPETLSAKLFFIEESHRTIAYYSKTTILLSFGWLLLQVKAMAKGRHDKKSFLLVTLMLWGLAYPLFFQKAADIHDYFLIYLAPFIAISASVLGLQIAGAVKSKNISRLILILLVLGLPLVQILQTKNFTYTLLTTSGNKPGMELGNLVSKNTAFPDKILVLSGQFGAFFGVFTNYYGDRTITYSDYSLSDFKKEQVDKKYDYVVYIDGRDTKEDVANYLTNDYPFMKKDIFTVFKTKK